MEASLEFRQGMLADVGSEVDEPLVETEPGQAATTMVKAIENAAVSIVTCQQIRGRAKGPCAHVVHTVRERL